MRKQVRKLRHWKQRWDRNADFVWSRRTIYAGVTYTPGDPIPDDLAARPTKLRRFWESKRIELAEFEAPNVATGQAEPEPDADALDPPEGVTVTPGNGSWFTVGTADGDVNVNGRRALERLLGELRVEADEADDTDPMGGPGAEAEDGPDVLVGSGMLTSTYEIGSETITLGEIVALTFEGTGLSVEEWNGMAVAERDMLLIRSLQWMADQGAIEDDDPAEPGTDEDKPERGEGEAQGPEAQADDAPEAEAAEATDDAWLDGSKTEEA